MLVIEKIDIIFLIISSRDNIYDHFVKRFWIPFIKIIEIQNNSFIDLSKPLILLAYFTSIGL